MPVDTISVELHPHSPLWAEMARMESTRLKDALGSILVAVHHVGSTSIPGIKAKPIIDLLPVAISLPALDEAMPRIAALGFECLGEFGLAGRRYCRRNDPATGKRVVQLHCYAGGFYDIERHLAFPAYLRAHPDVAKEYEAEKIRAGALHPDDVHAYNAEKNDWIKRVEKDAIAWWRR